MRIICFILLFFGAFLIAGIYGALHDQISFTVSSEYFTKFKYRQFGLLESAMPDRLKAAIIGFRATWWMGGPIGLIVGIFGFIHSSPRKMVLSTLKSFGVVAIIALLIGLCGLVFGFMISEQDYRYFGAFWPDDLQEPRYYKSVGMMHNFSYIGGIVGIAGGVVAQFIYRWKYRRSARKQAV